MATKEGEITFERGWAILQSGFAKLINSLEGISEQKFSPEEYMMFYATVYNMCTRASPHDYREQVYQGYKEIIQDYTSKFETFLFIFQTIPVGIVKSWSLISLVLHYWIHQVLSSLREKCDERLLEELVKRWSNHKVLVQWLARFFRYLDRYFLPKKELPTLTETGLGFFHDLVYREMKEQIRDITISMIDKEHRGEKINSTLLKNAVDFFVEIGMGSMTCYTNDFEASMLKDTAEYYSLKASNWIVVDSYADYMLKVDGCLKEEKDRVSHYLHSSSEQKLLEHESQMILMGGVRTETEGLIQIRPIQSLAPP